MVLDNNSIRVKIHILRGLYRESVGSWHDKASDRDKDCQELGIKITASEAVESDYFCASGITIEDTLLDDTGFHYIYRCYIQGLIDFIFGYAISLYKVHTCIQQ
ncbi:hypothetical protein L1987_40507 [Smallanthus sonchifolius]|uniref:Uncharacterized protein n=1 Tax=Smallanthus sonchifolius TaxID=185202 RepID=A0ACB9GSP8_9ASTR|nr:hypothetical protein L1987_40507 [Smallanthus sonchifolius]